MTDDALPGIIRALEPRLMTRGVRDDPAAVPSLRADNLVEVDERPA